MKEFEGFRDEDFLFMARLQQHNEKRWFDQNRERWEEVRENMRALCVGLTAFVNELDPGLETEPKTGRSLGRINRDTRFSNDKRPYKQNFDILFFPREFKRTTAPGFAVGITPEHSYIGTWLGAGMKEWRERFETNIAAHPAEFISYLEANGNFSGMSVRSESYKKPRIEGLPEPAFAWAQRKFYYMGLLTPGKDVVRQGRDYIALIEKTFIRLYPLYLFATSVSLPADLERFRDKFK